MINDNRRSSKCVRANAPPSQHSLVAQWSTSSTVIQKIRVRVPPHRKSFAALWAEAAHHSRILNL